MRLKTRSTGWLMAAMVAGMIAVLACGIALIGWLLMVVTGALHHETGWPPFTLSFWASAGIAAALSILAQIVRGEPIIKVSASRRY